MLALLPLLATLVPASSVFAVQEAAAGDAVGTGSFELNSHLARGDFYRDNFLGFTPATIALSKDKPSSVAKIPAVADSALYGTVVFGNGPHATTILLIDDPAKKIFIDANQDGDLSNDPEVKWSKVDKNERGEFLSGEFEFLASWKLSDGKFTAGKYEIAMYRGAGDARAFYYPLSGLSGKVTIEGKTYSAAMLDVGGPSGGHALFGSPGPDGAATAAPTLLIDLDADGTFRSLGHGEAFGTDGERASSIGDGWYLFSASDLGTRLTVKKGEVPLEVKYRKPMAKAGDVAPGFDMIGADGSRSSLADRKGKVVLVDFWATWCGPCQKAMPMVQEMHEKTKDRKDFEIIGLCVGDEKTAFDQWVAKNREKYTFTIGFDPVGRKVEENAQMFRWGISGIPFGAVIDKDGKVVETVTGYTPDNEKKIKAALKKLGVDVE